MKNYCLILFITFLVAPKINAQPERDSLLQVIESTPIDSNKVNYLNDLSKSFWRSDIEFAQLLATNALKLSREIDYQNGVCRSLNYLGIVFTNKGKFDSAMHYLNKAHDLAIAINHEKFQYFILNSKGIVERKLGNYESAITNYIEALEFAERIGTDRQVASIVMNIGNIHYNMDNFQKAITFYLRSLNLYEELDYSPAVDHLLNNLGDVYGKIQLYDSALHYFKKSLNNKINTDNQRGIGTTYVNIGMLSQAMDSIEYVKDYFQKAIVHYEKVGAEADAVHAYYGLSELNLRLNKLELSEKLAFQAMQISTEHNMKEQIKETHQLLANIYEKKGRFQQSLKEFRAFSSLKDSLFSEQTARTVNELEIKYETAKKEKEIIEANAQIEKKERFQVFLLIIIVTIIIFGTIGIFLLVQRFKLKKALLSQEIDTLRVQINSIFGGESKKLNISIDQINDGLYKPLSEREFQILNEAISEKTNSEIAEAVFVSVNTVKTHLKNIYVKLGVSNRKEALEVILLKS